MNEEKIIQNLKNVLSEKRFNHTISVANTAKELADMYGADSKKAYLAGLLHDCAKCYTKDELNLKIKEYNIELDDASKNSPQLWHSYVGACEAKEVYGVDDCDVLNAIYYHTIGRAGMSILEESIYLADAIEPLRDYDGAQILRKEAQKSLSKAVAMYTKMSIEFLKRSGKAVHPNAYDVLEFYRRQK